MEENQPKKEEINKQNMIKEIINNSEPDPNPNSDFLDIIEEHKQNQIDIIEEQVNQDHYILSSDIGFALSQFTS